MVMTRLSFLEERMSFGNRTGLLGPSPYCLGEHRKQETTPNSLPDWLEWTTKELCFFLHGNKLMQSRCSETWSEGQRWRLTHTGAGCSSSVSGRVSVGAQRDGNSQWHSWSRDFALINNNICAFDCSGCRCYKHSSTRSLPLIHVYKYVMLSAERKSASTSSRCAGRS